MNNNELQFNEEKHEYTINNTKIPSVTEIMTFLTDRKYETVTESILDIAKDKGTKVHLACELYNKTGYIGIEKEFKGYIEAYIKWIKDYNIDRDKIESEVKACERVLRYAGTVDMIYDKRIVIDIKTCAELDTKTTSVQTSAYREMLRYNGYRNISECYILWLGKDGNYKYVKLDNNFNVFLCCLTLYNFYN